MNKNFNKLLSEAIKAQDIEKNGCEYCCNDANEKIVDLYESKGRSKAAIINNGLAVIDGYGDYYGCDINYCPMCGRKLKEELKCN